MSEYLLERLILGGASRLCFVIAPGKADILAYFGGSVHATPICYTVQPRAAGLCDAVFRSLPLLRPDDQVMVGLPDTIWFPKDGLRLLADQVELAFLLFPVDRPERFDAVVTDEAGRVREIQVKRPGASSSWIWGAFRARASVLASLHELWRRRERRDRYLGTLVNAYLAAGGRATGVRAGRAYVDVGTLDGYREAMKTLEREGE